MKTSVKMRCPRCEQTSELDNLHLLDRSFKLKWVGLTDEERKEIALEVPMDAVCITEAKLKEKNT